MPPYTSKEMSIYFKLGFNRLNHGHTYGGINNYLEEYL